MKAIVAAIGRKLKGWFGFNDVGFLAAAAAVFYGIHQIHPPTAYIAVGGLFLILTTYGRFKQ